MQEDPAVPPSPGRREFTLAAMLAMLGGVSITVSACGGGGSSSPSTPSGGGGSTSSGDKSANITANHGHVAIITSAQLTAGNDLFLTIMGTADHTHTVTISASEVTQIAGGTRVSKTSSTTDHAHNVTFN